jgi:hypothetical protein
VYLAIQDILFVFELNLQKQIMFIFLPKATRLDEFYLLRCCDPAQCRYNGAQTRRGSAFPILESHDGNWCNSFRPWVEKDSQFALSREIHNFFPADFMAVMGSQPVE